MLSSRLPHQKEQHMTYREDFTLPAELLEQVQAHGGGSAGVDPGDPEQGHASCSLTPPNP